MSQSPPPSTAAPGPVHSPGQKRTAEGVLAAVLKAGIALLLVARLLVPAETAETGSTLWMVQLWLGLGVLWAWRCWATGDVRLRWGACDRWLAVLVLGHVVSALAVVMTEGHKRAALNMLWEWIGLGIAFFLLRQTLRTWRDCKPLILVMLAAVTALAGLGIWQHHVFYPRAARDYQELRGELDRLLQSRRPASPREAARRQQRIQELQTRLARQGAPLSGAGRILFEDRLRNSSEPFGLFALANSFAGLLVVWLVVALGATMAARAAGIPWLRILIGGLLVAGIAYCLVLTKSRTAWVGLMAGLATAAWWSRTSSRGGDEGPRVFPWLILAGLLTGVSLTVAAVVGGLDRDVVSQASKSLHYRLQYWTGTWGVLQEHPLLGTGPGNFRPHYLKHKLPASSEEISDPHNFVLDVWVSGGLLGVIGLAGLLVAGYKLFRDAARSLPEERPVRDRLQLRDPMVIGAALGFLAVLAVNGIWTGFVEQRLGVLLAGWFTVLVVLKSPFERLRLSPIWLLGGCIALLVHMLGAGGIEMPALAQQLLLLLAVAGACVVEHREPASRRRPRLQAGLGILMPALFLACLLSAGLPVLNRQLLVRSGDRVFAERNDGSEAERLYREAAARDPLSAIPLQRLAELAFHDWQRTGRKDAFRQAVEWQRRANKLAPHDFGGYRRLGEWFLARFARTGDPSDAEAAARTLAEAVRRYPHHAALRAERAQALAAAGNSREAGRQAQAALRLDAVNHREGHRDKYLPEPTVARLKQWARFGSGPKRGDRN